VLIARRHDDKPAVRHHAFMAHATFRVMIVNMDDGRPVMLLEFEPDAGIGPVVIDPLLPEDFGTDGFSNSTGP